MRYEAKLDDGTALVFRLIRPDDKGALVEAFGRLSDQARYYRFFTKLKRLNERQLRYLTEVDHEDHSAWVAVASTGGGREAQGVGVGRWVRLKGEPRCAEVAVTVVDDFQRRGIGRTLLHLAAVGAAAKGIEEFRASVLADNRATLQMLESAGALRGRWEAGVFELKVPLSAVVERADLGPLELEEVTE